MNTKGQTNRELLIELKTAVLGIEGTDDTGIAGDMKAIKQWQIEQNGYIKDNYEITTRNTAWIKAFKWVGGAIVFPLLGIIFTKGFGLW